MGEASWRNDRYARQLERRMLGRLRGCSEHQRYHQRSMPLDCHWLRPNDM